MPGLSLAFYRLFFAWYEGGFANDVVNHQLVMLGFLQFVRQISTGQFKAWSKSDLVWLPTGPACILFFFSLSLSLAICVFVLGKRLGCLEEEVPANCKVFIEELHNFITVTQELLFKFPFHKFVTTKNWKALVHSQKCVYEVAMGHVQEKVV